MSAVCSCIVSESIPPEQASPEQASPDQPMSLDASSEPLTERGPQTLPNPDGVWGHVTYSVHAVRLMRDWRRELEALDKQLRNAVIERDESLARLGEAMMAAPDARQQADNRVSRFAETLAALDGERATIDGRRETLTIELAAAEADRRARLADHDGQRDALDDEVAPIERALAEQGGRLDDLEQAARDDVELVSNIERRLAHITAPETIAAADRDTLALFDEERARIAQRQAEVAARVGPRALEIAALRPPVDELRALVTTLRERREAIVAARQALDASTQAIIEDLRHQRDAEVERLERLDARRRAALVDLGREALHHDDRQDEASQMARASLEAINSLRARRSAVRARRAALDEGPVRRTVGVAVGLGLVALLIWWFI